MIMKVQTVSSPLVPSSISAEPEYLWSDQSCPLCIDAGARRLGRRGGAAHRFGLGVVSFIYRCRGCGLIFPNPMPVPSQLSEHYGDADKYFTEHSLDGKVAAWSSQSRI